MNSTTDQAWCESFWWELASSRPNKPEPTKRYIVFAGQQHSVN